ncbi:MAG: rRNA maturation RNase YbeY [Candidatus Omnitrophica bacterium]|nr:rRNA maturation RNase YbeY [Candidatus Omnitrophota bacterium]
MKISIVNQQRLKRLNLKELELTLKLIGKNLNISSKNMSLVVCDNDFIKNLNKKYFNKNTVTDVISFPLTDKFDKNDLGEIVVSLEEAVLRAKDYGNTWKEEFTLYLIHGILHLLGYEDSNLKNKKVMDQKQQEVLRIICKSKS